MYRTHELHGNTANRRILASISSPAMNTRETPCLAGGNRETCEGGESAIPRSYPGIRLIEEVEADML